MAERARKISIGSASSARRSSGSFRKLDPRIQIKNPVMFIVEVGSLLTTIVFIQDLAGGRRAAAVHRPGRLLALVHGRCSPTSPRRWPRGAARRRRPRCARHGPRRRRIGLRGGRRRRCTPAPCARATSSGRTPGRVDPGDGEIIEGVAVGRRVGDHWRVGAGHPRIGRLIDPGDRRHRVHLGLDQGADHVEIRATRSSTA